ncbi:MAG TPA: FecR family protein [Calditrichia bacterium]|nr:FecR family protein [Calditrichia bacterium]HQV31286.1 FecR family protein [Calditrichia bacterium]
MLSLTALLWLFGSAAQADDNIAVVVKVNGKVSLTAEKSTESVPVKKGQVLKNRDRLETGAEAYCILKFLDDKSLLRINEKSSCIIEGKKEADAIDKNIFVELGSFFASLFQPKGKFEVTTPTSVASVKGTQFWVIQLGKAGPTRVVVTEGIVEVRNRAGKALAKKGQTASVASRTSPPEVRLTRSGDIPDAGEEELESQQNLEFEFEDSDGRKKVLRIKIEEER